MGKISAKRKKIKKPLIMGEEPFRKAFDLGVVGMGTTDPRTYYWLSANKRLCEITGYTEEELLKKTWVEITCPKEKIKEDKAGIKKIIDRKVNGYIMEKQYIHKDGHLVDITLSVQGVHKTDETIDYLVVLIDDITKRKNTEKLLQQQKKDLEYKNIALREVLSQIEIDKKEMKNNIAVNVENLLLPILKKIRLKGGSRKYLNLLEKSLKELTSSFGVNISKKQAKLTSREVEICNMIKNGLVNKEIADLLNISSQTIERHRANIRKKLGIVNQKVNLISFLKTLD